MHIGNTSRNIQFGSSSRTKINRPNTNLENTSQKIQVGKVQIGRTDLTNKNRESPGREKAIYHRPTQLFRTRRGGIRRIHRIDLPRSVANKYISCRWSCFSCDCQCVGVCVCPCCYCGPSLVEASKEAAKECSRPAGGRGLVFFGGGGGRDNDCCSDIGGSQQGHPVRTTVAAAPEPQCSLCCISKK